MPSKPAPPAPPDVALQDTVNPPYVVPVGYADAPPPVVADDPNRDPETQVYLDGFTAAPDPRDPGSPPLTSEEYTDGFVKPPDPRDPPTSVLTPGELIPPSNSPAVAAEDPFGDGAAPPEVL